MKDWFKKRKISLKGRINTTSMILSIFILMMMLVVGIKDSYSATVPFEGAMMGTFPTTIKNQRENIVEVNFIKDTEQNINTRYNKASIKVDLTYNSTIKVFGWLEPISSDTSKYVLYVASVDKIYLSTGNNLFYEWKNLKTINFNNIDTSQVTNMWSMFEYCNGLTNLDLSNFDTSKVTNMGSLFCGCKTLTDLDLSNFDTSQVTDMKYMFCGCSGLTKLDVSNFNTSQVTNMWSMFEYCNGLTNLDLSNFDTSKVTTMDSMFYGCNGLTKLDVSNFNTSQVTNMGYMFCDCGSLTKLDVSNFDTSKVTNMGSMFRGCKTLTDLDLSNFDTSQVTDMKYMFCGCSGLTKLDVSNFDVNKAKSLNSGLKLEGISVIISSPYILFNKLTNVGQIKDLFAGVVYSNNNVTKTDNDKFATNDYIIDTNSKKYYIYVLGDTNGDGELTLSDIMKTANYVYKNKNSLSGAYLKAADYNLDGSYNLQDIMKMANALYKGGK